MKNLFVGNLSFQTTESDVRALFQPFGQITRVHMAMDRETGRARGFAFVEMPNDDEAKKARGPFFSGRNRSLAESVRALAEGGLATEPGAEFHYCTEA